MKKISYAVPASINPEAPYARLATWFGCGFLSPGPGTWGSLGALPFGLALYMLGGMLLLLMAICVIIPIGLWAAHEFDKAIDGHDSKMIVIDEVAGMWIAMVAAGLNAPLVLMAFASFRLFDILKPWPVSYFDRHFKNSFGVMMDDILAGLMACVVVAVCDLWI